MSPADTLAARRAAIGAIEEEAEKKTGLQSEMVTLYQGAQYHLYLYKKFTDVRLVFAPEFDIAFFGGDPDNFTFPRYCLDMTLFRVYENGKPLQVTALPAVVDGRRQGRGAGVHVGTSGHDAAPEHHCASRVPARPCAAIQPRDVHAHSRCAGRVRQTGAEQERQAKDLFFGIENSLKSWKGQLQGLQDPALMKKKRSAETALRAAVAKNPDYTTRFGDAWDAVDTAAPRSRPTTSNA